MSIAPTMSRQRKPFPRPSIQWPPKLDLFGVSVSAATYEQTEDAIVAAAGCGLSAVVSCHAVHAVVTASLDPVLRARVNSFDIVAPDGQPVRWALNLLHGTRLTDRVYGPELMIRVCSRAAAARIPIFLCGGTRKVVERLGESLSIACPGLRIAGIESPPFRPLTVEEDEALVKRIQSSGARIVFVGLGCPKQDHFAYEHRQRIRAVQVCVGAAFELHAGVKKMAPAWMQRNGLEWLFRLAQEPRRLAARYLLANPWFLARTTAELLGRQMRPAGSRAAELARQETPGPSTGFHRVPSPHVFLSLLHKDPETP
jgi:N-acetylglucosaminyldiphosphoundecaprenol N-acetyl-beta-D-mannosaminyltransferase